MKRAMFELLLLGMFILSGGSTDTDNPLEMWLPAQLYVGGQQLIGLTLPFGIIYLGESSRSNDTPQVQVKLHERRHWVTMREMGIVSYYAHYFFIPGWACREEARAGWARYHTACR